MKRFTWAPRLWIPTAAEAPPYDTIEVDGGWRCSQMIEFPVRINGVWPDFNHGDRTNDTDFVFPVAAKLITEWKV